MLFIRLVCVVALCLSLFVTQASANQDFNASTHQQARYGGKTCFVTHHHYGESPSWPNRRGAQKAAIRKWEWFTKWEYGARWGSYRLARGKQMQCAQSGGRWICKTTAYPCRR